MIVFDLQYPKTFENIEEFWLEEIAKYAEKDVKIFVVGNKADCE